MQKWKAGALSLLVAMGAACATVDTTRGSAECDTCEVTRTRVQTMGAVDVTVDGDAILVESDGFSEGFVGMVGSALTTARDALLGLIGRERTEPPVVNVTVEQPEGEE